MIFPPLEAASSGGLYELAGATVYEFGHAGTVAGIDAHAFFVGELPWANRPAESYKDGIGESRRSRGLGREIAGLFRASV